MFRAAQLVSKKCNKFSILFSNTWFGVMIILNVVLIIYIEIQYFNISIQDHFSFVFTHLKSFSSTFSFQSLVPQHSCKWENTYKKNPLQIFQHAGIMQKIPALYCQIYSCHQKKARKLNWLFLFSAPPPPPTHTQWGKGCRWGVYLTIIICRKGQGYLFTNCMRQLIICHISGVQS